MQIVTPLLMATFEQLVFPVWTLLISTIAWASNAYLCVLIHFSELKWLLHAHTDTQTHNQRVLKSNVCTVGSRWQSSNVLWTRRGGQSVWAVSCQSNPCVQEQAKHEGSWRFFCHLRSRFQRFPCLPAYIFASMVCRSKG